MNAKTKAWTAGICASALLSLLYVAILSISNTVTHVWEQFVDLWPWMVGIIAGFGLQIGLFVYLRAQIKEKHAAAQAAASGGISAASMVACCAHHLTDILPIIGLSAAALFITKYQLVFLMLGVLSNVTGVVFMLKIMQKNDLLPQNAPLTNMFRKYQLKSLVVLSLIIGIALLYLTWLGAD